MLLVLGLGRCSGDFFIECGNYIRKMKLVAFKVSKKNEKVYFFGIF